MDYSQTWKFTVTPPRLFHPYWISRFINILQGFRMSLLPGSRLIQLSGYRIEIDDDAKFRSPLVDEALAEGVRVYNLTGLERSKYYWRVCSRNEYGAEGGTSGYAGLRWRPIAPLRRFCTPPKIFSCPGIQRLPCGLFG